MKKILVIGYGGTIVMVVDPVKKAVVPADAATILSLLPRVQDVADLQIDIIDNKDSTNINPEDWARLAVYILDHYNDFDAFVITHDTNTMAYTASALTLAFGTSLGKPIIITGSQLPLTVYGNDARFNFENSIKVAAAAAERRLAEVMIVFDDVILRGCRSMKVSESAFRAFESPAFQELGRITSTGIHFNTTVVRHASTDSTISLQPHFQSNILSIDLTPGLQPRLLETFIASGQCRGMVLKSHGAGSVPTIGEWSLIPFIRRAVNELKIPIIVASKFLGGNAYKEVNDQPAIDAIEAGAIPAGDMTTVACEVKLMWLLANGAGDEQSIRQNIMKNHVGEMSDVPMR